MPINSKFNSNRLKILIVKLSAIGDVVQSTVIINALKAQFPDCYIGWAVEDRAKDIIVDNPLVDRVFIFERQKWKNRAKKNFLANIANLKNFFDLITEIRKERFDIAIDLQELFKSASITYLSGAERRIAHDKTRELAHLFVNEKLPAHDNFDPNKLIIERYLDPAVYIGCSADNIKFVLPNAKPETVEFIDKLIEQTDKSKEIIIFSPATIWKTKHWLKEYWAELLDFLAEDFNIVFVGSGADSELIERIRSSAKYGDKAVSFAGKTNISQLIELCRRSRFFIAPDTGPSHIANATQVPNVIMIFGPTGYKRTPPYGKKHYALSTELACQPCFKRECPRAGKNYMECMKKIIPENVLNIIKSTKVSN